MPPTSLKFAALYKVTIADLNSADSGFAFIAMGVKQRAVALPGGVTGVELRYRVNNPERFEHALVGKVALDDDHHVMIEKVVEPDSQDETVYAYTFEPLTLEVWKGMDIVGSEEMKHELLDDEALKTYYLHDWVPDTWTEAWTEEDPLPGA